MIVDILVLAVLLISAIISFLRGFIREILTIFGIVGGMIAAYIGGPLVIPMMQEWLGVDPKAEEPQKLMDIIPLDMVASALAYGGLFIVFVIILSILSHFIAEGAKNIGLGALDRTLGVVFGLGRGVLFIGLLYLPVYYNMGEKDKEDFFKESKSYVYMEMTSGWIGSFIPKSKEKEEEEGEEGDVTLFNKAEDIQKSVAREALENLNLLGKDKQEEAPEQEENGQQKSLDGYGEDFRENIDKLIEENITPPETDEPSGY